MTQRNAADPLSQASYVARLFMFSVLISEGVLLLKLSGWENGPFNFALAFAFVASFLAANGLAGRWSILGRKILTMRHLGFLFAAAGLVLILLGLSGREAGEATLAGAFISGAGLGIVRYAARTPSEISMVKRVSGLLIAGVVLAVTVLIQTFSAPGTTGYCFALGLLIDLVLLGGLYVRVNEQEEGCLR